MARYKMKSKSGGKDGGDLLKMLIAEKDDGSGYVISGELQKTNDTVLPVTLPKFDYAGWTWTITITSVTGTGMSGKWSNNDPSIEEEEGTWETTTVPVGEAKAAGYEP